MIFPMVPHMVLIETFETTHRKGINNSRFGSSQWICWENEPQTHSRNHVYFQLSLPFFKNVKELGQTLIYYFGLSKNTKTSKSNFMSRLCGNVRWGTFLITIERVTFY